MKTLDYLHLNEKKVAGVASALHQLLADFQVHYTNLRGMHWNIKGHGFFVLHEKFESMYDDTAEKIDEIAERILMLGGVPENKFSEYLKVANVKEVSDISCGSEAVDHILETYGYLIGEEREALEPLLSQNITQLQIPINNQLITIIIKSKYYRISLAISIFGCIFGCGISNTPSHEHQTKHHFCT